MSNQDSRLSPNPHFVLTAQQQRELMSVLDVTAPPMTDTQAATASTEQAAVDPSIFNLKLDSFNSDVPYYMDFPDTSGILADTTLVSNPSDGDVDEVENEVHEKRALPDDVAEDNDASRSAAKKRETAKPDKVAKKPGRKPLTEEPTTKRKAQNRAAQRAFRERKEKHVRDLEIKVEELEKASEQAVSENAALKETIERLTAELQAYKKAPLPRLSTDPRPGGFGSAAISRMPDIDFKFDFPMFGQNSGSGVSSHSRSQSQTLPSPAYSNGHQSSQSFSQMATQAANGAIYAMPPFTYQPNYNTINHGQQASTNFGSASPQQQNVSADLARFSNIFSDGETQSPTGDNRNGNGAAGSNSGYGATSSPSSSSNPGTISSCGTSPEPFKNSPNNVNKAMDNLATIGEESTTIAFPAPGLSGFGTLDNLNIDWLAQHTSGAQFDPQLFGDYREPQENILNNGGGEKTLFDADSDFLFPYNQAPVSTSNQFKASDLIAQIDAVKEMDAPLEEQKEQEEKLPCNKIWNTLQNCPKVQAGEFDLDSLCTELQKKATCGGKGPVVKQVDFNTILEKYLGKQCAEGFREQQEAEKESKKKQKENEKLFQ